MRLLTETSAITVLIWQLNSLARGGLLLARDGLSAGLHVVISHEFVDKLRPRSHAACDLGMRFNTYTQYQYNSVDRKFFRR